MPEQLGYDEAVALFEQLRSSSDPGVAERASAQMQTAKDYKANPMLAIEDYRHYESLVPLQHALIRGF